MAPTHRLAKYFKDYSSYHRTEGNVICHWIGIPMIVATLLGLLALAIDLGPIGGVNGLLDPDYFRWDGGMLLILAATAWYMYLDWKIAVAFLFVSLGFYFIGRSMPTSTLWTLFILGWIGQLVGHIRYEKNSPAFTKNFEHLFIGPLWLFAKITRYD